LSKWSTNASGRGRQSSTVPVVNVGPMRVCMRDGLVIVFVDVGVR
jgi:hypothetical protein